MRYFYFNGKRSDDYFWINSISRGYLPPITVPSFKVPNKPGAVALKKNEIDVREIEIDITLWANDDSDLRVKTRALADFLIYSEDKLLYFSDEPGMVYYARFNNDNTNLEELAAIGEGTLNFTCFDPFAYRQYETNHLISGVESAFINNGSGSAFPRIRVVPTVLQTYVTVRNVTTNKSITYNATLNAWTNILIIDTKTNQSYIEQTGENVIKNISLDSDFFELIPGENIIKIENGTLDGAGIANGVRLYWTERFY